MRLYSILAIAALASASLIARADTYTVFDFNSTYNYGVDLPLATITGTITLDTSKNPEAFTSVDLTASGFASIIDVDNLDVIKSEKVTDGVEDIVITDPSDLLVLDLYLPVDTLNGYTGGDLCSHGTSGCDSKVTAYDYVYGADTGSLTPESDPAPTPEPSSLLLLGTGLIGIGGVVRRRLA